MSSAPVGIGVVGWGYWGPNLVRYFATNEAACIIGVTDISAAIRAKCRTQGE
jgi:hypothetical protein